MAYNYVLSESQNSVIGESKNLKLGIILVFAVIAIIDRIATASIVIATVPNSGTDTCTNLHPEISTGLPDGLKRRIHSFPASEPAGFDSTSIIVMSNYPNAGFRNNPENTIMRKNIICINFV